MEPFCGVCHLRQSTEICPVHCVIIPYGSKHRSKMWSCYGSAKQAAFTAEFGLTTHSRPLWVHFSECFLVPVFKRFFTPCFHAISRYRAVFFLCQQSPAPAPTWVKNMGQAVSPLPGQDLHPTPRCRDCTIAFRNCKSFLCEKNCRQTASTDTTRRQLTKRIEQTESFNRRVT